MQLYQLKPKTKQKREQRVGRGDKTAGRGTKGQKSRAGAKIRPAIRDIIKKLPKRRGYRFRSFQQRPAVITLSRLEASFQGGAIIDPAALISKGLLRKIKGRTPAVKILGNAALTKRFTFRGFTASSAARSRIEQAGGSIQP